MVVDCGFWGVRVARRFCGGIVSAKSQLKQPLGDTMPLTPRPVSYPQSPTIDWVVASKSPNGYAKLVTVKPCACSAARSWQISSRCCCGRELGQVRVVEGVTADLVAVVGEGVELGPRHVVLVADERRC